LRSFVFSEKLASTSFLILTDLITEAVALAMELVASFSLGIVLPVVGGKQLARF
jgi:hypothetical protein